MTDYTSAEFWKGAPEGATHYQPAKHHNQRPAFWRVVGGVAREVWCLSADSALLNDHFRYGPDGNDCFDAVMSIPRPAPPWSGDGLPPVGTVCEFKEHAGDTWAECTIIGDFRGRIICGCNQTGAVGYIDLGELRPIRTPEQIAADEREAAIEAIYDLISSRMGSLNVRELATAIHDARVTVGD